MALKKPAQKMESSFATFEFINKELPYMFNTVGWERLASLPHATIRNPKEHKQMEQQTTIAVLAYHAEIMKESLREHMRNLSMKDNFTLIELDLFLSQLRNALLHAKGELIPKWLIDWEKIKKENREKAKSLADKWAAEGFTIKVRGKKIAENFQFDAKSKKFYVIKFKVRLNKKITINSRFISKLRWLSYHVLHILKTEKIERLENYLNKTTLMKRSK